MEKVRAMRGVNLIGNFKIGDKNVELTKSLIYVQKDAKKQAVTLLFKDKSTLEDIGVMDKTPLVITEVLTETAKQIVDLHYSMRQQDA